MEKDLRYKLLELMSIHLEVRVEKNGDRIDHYVDGKNELVDEILKLINGNSKDK